MTTAGIPSRAARHGPVLTLVALVVVTTAVYAGVAQLVSTPRMHPDELIYSSAASSLAEGKGLTIRGEPYEYGPLYPGLLAPVHAVAGDRATAYPFYKITNALLFALVAIPAYLLARRLLRPWWSIGVAALSVTVPASMYVGLVLTESTAYLACSIALWAMVATLERPTPARQAGVLAALLVAYAARAQLATLVVAYVAALFAMWLIDPERTSLRDLARRIWPTLVALALAVVAVVARPVLSGSSPLDAVGAYEVLFRAYNPLDVARWTAYHVGDLAIYFALVPVAVAPIVLALLWRRARSGSRPPAAFLTTFVGANAVLLLVTAAFATTEFAYDRLHDRNVFYLAPLWFVVLGVWLAEGLPRPRPATAIGIALALALVVALPFQYIASDVGVDVVPSALWARLQESLAGEFITARKLLVLVALALLAAVAALPRRLWWAFPAAVLAASAVTATMAWTRIADAAENHVFEGGRERAWVDSAIAGDARVTKLYLDTDCGSALERHALFLTEAFNGSVERAAYIGDSTPDGLPIERVDVGPGGTLLRSPRNALEAEYVLTQHGLELDGEQIATGTNADLALWRIDGRVAVVGAESNDELAAAVCA